MLISGPSPKKGFTKAPNELLSCSLSAGEKITWLQLASSMRDGESCDLRGGLATVAGNLGIPYNNLVKAVKRLEKAGGCIRMRHSLELIIPDARMIEAPRAAKKALTTPEPLAEPEAPVEPEEEKFIAAEQEALPNRKPTGLKPADREVLIKEAWNKWKPESWCKLDGRISPPLYIAIEAQTKRLSHDRDDYDGFMKRVLNGAKIDGWWSQKVNMKAPSLFGFGQPEDRKFINVEKLYNLGGTQQAASAGFDTTEQAFVDWYGLEPTLGIKKVQFITVDSEDEAWDNDMGVYEGTAFVWFLTGRAKPIHWSLKLQNSKFRYLP